MAVSIWEVPSTSHDTKWWSWRGPWRGRQRGQMGALGLGWGVLPPPEDCWAQSGWEGFMSRNKHSWSSTLATRGRAGL